VNEEIQKLINAAQTAEYAAFNAAMAPLPYDKTTARSTVVLQGTDPQNRPGDVLHGILREEHGFKVASCKCQEWIDRMNRWGCSGCREHMSEIVEHLFEEASANPQVSQAIRIGLKVPIIGAFEGRRRITAIVERAISMADESPNHRMSVEEIAIRLASPAHKWPDGWRNWPNVVEYHRELLRHELDRSPQDATTWIVSDGKAEPIINDESCGSGDIPSAQKPSRAILIPAGGRCQIYDKNAPQFYFWGAYAAAWVLRSYGCTLPIQFWFLPGEMEEIEFCELHARRVAATCHVVDTTGMRCVHGWQIKINAILQSEYQQIIHLDADNIVTKDPSYLFDCETFQQNAAMFWMDNPNVNDFHGRIVEDQWRRVGSNRTDRINDVETGQMVIDKRRAAKALRIVKHFADRADYWEGFNGGDRGVWYGDKTSFHMGFKLTGTPHHIQPWNRWNAGGFYEHCDPSGSVIFQHACHRKGHLNNGHAIQNLKGNQLIEEASAFKGPLAFLDGSVEDAMRCIAPERCFAIEPDRISRETWLDVLGRNEYLLAPTIPSDAVVIDIGANSGAFSYACLRRGAGRVLAFEPGPVAELAEKNCSEFGDRFDLTRKAVWRSDQPADVLTLATSHSQRHSGSMSAVLPKTGKPITVETIDLDSVLRQFNQVHILKLDCEGSEYPILMTSTELHRVEHILGEYHHVDDVWSMHSLKIFLQTRGFEVYRIIEHAKTHGNFWARKMV
jgi:FkbM family methyltransferase